MRWHPDRLEGILTQQRRRDGVVREGESMKTMGMRMRMTDEERSVAREICDCVVELRGVVGVWERDEGFDDDDDDDDDEEGEGG